jgi:hypothetical protein
MNAINKMSPQLMIAIGSTALIVIIVIFALFYSKQMQTVAKSTKDLLDEGNGKKEGEPDDFDYAKFMEQIKGEGNGGAGSNEDSSIEGQTDKYEWHQSEDEIEMKLSLQSYGEGITAREVDVSLSPKHLKVTIRRQVIIDDDFCDSIRSDDSCWFLDTASQEITIHIEKATPTAKKDFWSYILKNDRKGPDVHHLDANDPDSVAAAIKKVSL